MYYTHRLFLCKTCLSFIECTNLGHLQIFEDAKKETFTVHFTVTCPTAFNPPSN